ncbi:unnamed protein product [Dimorphilus gyrociliatus]|uniref:G-protein coupled receptors family 1 profile domain-containing protein n=1 Tax=Dimorphilus gyrociliatus TaxID=2664684 RepID=A0A7I8W012_9ANNE|nr:unnamed protein product [Dimorphilus gyrociliatus]
MSYYNNSTEANDERPTAIGTTIGASVMTVFLIEGILGNVWLIAAVVSQRQYRNIINLFIASLALNDLLTLCLVVVLIVQSYVMRSWVAGDVLCKLNPEFTIAFVGCSLWHTALIGIHRYIVVVHNTVYKRMSKKSYVAFVLIAARLIPFAAALPGIDLKSSVYVAKLLRCILKPTSFGRIVSVTVVQVLIPCIVVVCCYIAIFISVVKVSKRMSSPNALQQRELQITKMFGVIFLVILGGFIPYSIVRNLDKANTLSAEIYVIVSVFYGVATCSSPLVYGAMSTEIRTAMLDFCPAILKKRAKTSVTAECRRMTPAQSQPVAVQSTIALDQNVTVYLGPISEQLEETNKTSS